MYKYMKIQRPQFQRNYVIAWKFLGEGGVIKDPPGMENPGGWGGDANQRVFHGGGGGGLFFDHQSVHLFQTNQCFQEIELILWTVPIWKSSKPKLSSQNMRGCSHATIIIPSLHLPLWECLGPQQLFCVQNMTEKHLQIMSLTAYAMETN